LYIPSFYIITPTSLMNENILSRLTELLSTETLAHSNQTTSLQCLSALLHTLVITTVRFLAAL